MKWGLAHIDSDEITRWVVEFELRARDEELERLKSKKPGGGDETMTG